MLIIRLLRFLRGYLLITATGGYTERWLNMLSQKNFPCWNMQMKQYQMQCCVFAYNYREIAKMAKKSGVKVRIQKKVGLPFRLRKRRRRVGLFVGIAVFLAFLFGMQNFVWSIEIVGNDQISTERIEYVLQKQEIYLGAFLPSLDLNQITNEVAIELDHVSWLAINNTGSRIMVELNEYTVVEDVDKETSCNLVASKSGLIQQVVTYSGQQVIEVNQVVAQGDLLVSGILDAPVSGSMYAHADGKVIAQTVTTETFTCLKQTESKQYTGNQVERNYLQFGDSFRLPLFISGGDFSSCDAQQVYEPFYFFGVELPFGVYRITYNEYEINSLEYNQGTAQVKLERLLQNYLKTRMIDAEILDTFTEWEETEDAYLLHVEIVALEDIAEKQQLIL